MSIRIYAITDLNIYFMQCFFTSMVQACKYNGSGHVKLHMSNYDKMVLKVLGLLRFCC